MEGGKKTRPPPIWAGGGRGAELLRCEMRKLLSCSSNLRGLWWAVDACGPVRFCVPIHLFTTRSSRPQIQRDLTFHVRERRDDGAKKTPTPNGQDGSGEQVTTTLGNLVFEALVVL